MLWSATLGSLPMPTWLILQLLAIACMPTAYGMARDRARSTKAWLWATLIFGPLALIALVVLGHARNGHFPQSR
jgi:hypothetical protein